jgi:organic radical activating enzyme
MNIYASYQCNLCCSFCSLWNNNSQRIDLNWVKEELKQHPDLAHDLTILGGEPSVLPVDYQQELIAICAHAEGKKPYYITNLLSPSPVISQTNLIVSYDFDLRKQHKKVLYNIINLNQEFAISTILTDHLINHIGAIKYLKFIDSLKNCKRADLVIYYKSKKDKLDYTPQKDSMLEFVSTVMSHSKVCMAPLSQMKNEIPCSFDDMSDFFAFLPDNNYGVRLDYDNGPYKKFNTYKDAKLYYDESIKNSLCSKCKYINYCWYPCSSNTCHGEKEMMEIFYNYAKQQKIRKTS